VHGSAGRVLRDAAKVGVVLRPEVVDAEDGLVAPDLTDVHAGRPREAAEHHLFVPEPGEGHGEVAVRGRAEHRNALAQAQVLRYAELVQGRRDYEDERLRFHGIWNYDDVNLIIVVRIPVFVLVLANRIR
jgi:hypothetical protein